MLYLIIYVKMLGMLAKHLHTYESITINCNVLKELIEVFTRTLQSAEFLKFKISFFW